MFTRENGSLASYGRGAISITPLTYFNTFTVRSVDLAQRAAKPASGQKAQNMDYITDSMWPMATHMV